MKEYNIYITCSNRVGITVSKLKMRRGREKGQRRTNSLIIGKGREGYQKNSEVKTMKKLHIHLYPFHCFPNHIDFLAYSCIFFQKCSNKYICSFICAKASSFCNLQWYVKCNVLFSQNGIEHRNKHCWSDLLSHWSILKTFYFNGFVFIDIKCICFIILSC